MRKSEGDRDVMRSTHFEGGAIREVKGDEGQRLGGKKGASKGKLVNCTKMPVQPESAMRGEDAMRADKTECAEGRPERCDAMVGDRGEEKGNGSETGRPRESKCTRKDREGEAGARGARCANAEGSNASDGEKGSGSVEVEAEAETRVDEGSSESASESEAENASRQAKAFACEKRDEKDEWGKGKRTLGEGDDMYSND